MALEMGGHQSGAFSPADYFNLTNQLCFLITLACYVIYVITNFKLSEKKKNIIKFKFFLYALTPRNMNCADFRFCKLKLAIKIEIPNCSTKTSVYVNFS